MSDEELFGDSMLTAFQKRSVIFQNLEFPWCNNNNLRNIHIIIPCRRSFSVLVIISGISPYTNLRLCILFSK